MRFENKTAAVSGGASGIGRATVMALGKGGARVYFGDIDKAKGADVESEAKAQGFDVVYVPLDITDDASISRFTEKASAGGRLDVLVNAAGWDRIEPFIDNTPDFWNRIIAINFMGPVKLTRAILPTMIEARAGKIVNVASDAGRVGSTGETIYAGAKGGVIAFTKSLAREMARYQINVNCICPGPTDTPLFRAQPERMQEALTRAIPFRRVAKPEEVADGILFFASARSDFCTGQVLSVSGGLTMVD